MWVNLLPHTVTHMPKWLERSKECRVGSLHFLPGFFLSALHDLPYETVHGHSCLDSLLL